MAKLNGRAAGLCDSSSHFPFLSMLVYLLNKASWKLTKEPTPPLRCACVHECILSHVWLFATSWTSVHQAPVSMEFPRQEYSSRLLFPPPEDLPDPGIEPVSPTLKADALLSEPPGKFWCILYYLRRFSCISSGVCVSHFETHWQKVTLIYL